MGQYNRYYTHQSGGNKYTQYLNMPAYIRVENYENYRFVSIFETKFCNKNIWVRQGQIHYDDLIALLTDASEAKNYLNWVEALQIKEFKATAPKLEGLLSEPQKPQEPVYDSTDPLAMISQQPIYTKPDVKINFIRNSAPKLTAVIENLILYIHKLFYKFRLARWEQYLKEIDELKKDNKIFQAYQQDLKHYNDAHNAWKQKHDEYENKLKEASSYWDLEKERFNKSAGIERERLYDLKLKYDKNEKDAIEDVVKIILLRSPYPESFPRHFEVNYDLESKILIIDYQLPDFERFEILEDSKRIDSKPVAQYKRKSIVRLSLPTIAIRTLYEVAITDKNNAISSIVFNGWVNFIDKTNGNERSEYIISVHATKNDINKLAITKIDPLECFKSLKGLVAKNILEYIPIAPILIINKKDNRLIQGREIIEGMSPNDNLAAMDWNDFEHLIRELFEKEFSKSNAEVRITHASHDRGVDAIIYDPDPIRGGKFVIQAKRYTKLVDVSAVRDLYGTIQNEGANRGILVTTSHYGSDAYEFAKNKNITLLTGENLLHLLEKHGYKFKIDIKEARKLLNLK